MQTAKYYDFDDMRTSSTPSTFEGKELLDRVYNQGKFETKNEKANVFFNVTTRHAEEMGAPDFADDETDEEFEYAFERETQEHFARDILGATIVSGDKDLFEVALEHIGDIKEVKFSAEGYESQDLNIVEFTVIAEAKSQVQPEMLAAVMETAKLAYGEDVSKKMQADAAAAYGQKESSVADAPQGLMGIVSDQAQHMQSMREKTAMVMQANGDAMEQLLNSVGKALDGAYKGNTNSDEYVRYDTVREPFIDNLISLKENDFFSKAPERVGELIVGLERATGGKVSLNEKGTLEFSGDLGKTGPLREASLGIKDCLDRARADEQSQKAFWENARQDHASRLQKNDGIVKDLGAAAMPEVIGALKKSMEGMSTSGMSADAKQDFFKAQGEASKALDSMAGMGASNDPHKVAKMMTDFESSFGGKFSKGQDGKLSFDYKSPVDARQATDLAQETGRFAKGAVMAEKAAEQQGPKLEAQKAPANQAPKEAKIETSSTGRITGGGRFSRPPSPEAVAQSRQEPPERKRSSGRSL